MDEHDAGPPKSSLGHFPGDRWEFDAAVTDVFDDMLARSIPQLDAMREVVYQVARRLIQPHTDVVDLGCARGEGLARLISEGEFANRFIGVENSEAMLDVCRRRFRGGAGPGTVEIRQQDLRTGYPDARPSLTLCILTVQFVPVEDRLRLLSEARARTVPGGGIILVEKVEGETEFASQLLKDLYYLHKRKMGYSQEEIEAKRLSLEGVLVPLTASCNEQLLRNAGFGDVECIWRYLNFCGWVAIA